MASVQTFYLPHYPNYPIFVCLFKDVKNASFLRQQLLEGNAAFEYAFLDATMILSPHHILTAAFRSLHTHLTSRLKSRNPHSELVFCLSPNNNIAESFRRFGIADTTTDILAVKIGLTPDVTAESVSTFLGEHVEGRCVELGGEGEERLSRALEETGDLERIGKVYKLGGGGKGGKKGRVNGVGGEVDERKEVESVVLGIMALKGS